MASSDLVATSDLFGHMSNIFKPQQSTCSLTGCRKGCLQFVAAFAVHCLPLLLLLRVLTKKTVKDRRKLFFKGVRSSLRETDYRFNGLLAYHEGGVRQMFRVEQLKKR